MIGFNRAKIAAKITKSLIVENKYHAFVLFTVFADYYARVGN